MNTQKVVNKLKKNPREIKKHQNRADSLFPKRTHIAIMRKSWGLMQKILSGEKTVESRWYRNRYKPWNQIASGDTIYFKDSGEPVEIKAVVTKVLQFENLNSKKIKEILDKYGKNDLGIQKKLPKDLKDYLKNKNYCILVFFDSVQKIKPFEIDKTGFGAMSSWLIVEDIEKIELNH